MELYIDREDYHKGHILRLRFAFKMHEPYLMKREWDVINQILASESACCSFWEAAEEFYKKWPIECKNRIPILCHYYHTMTVDQLDYFPWLFVGGSQAKVEYRRRIRLLFRKVMAELRNDSSINGKITKLYDVRFDLQNKSK